jgi:hypothetical protein
MLRDAHSIEPRFADGLDIRSHVVTGHRGTTASTDVEPGCGFVGEGLGVFITVRCHQ